jgi:hypothetical protein
MPNLIVTLVIGTVLIVLAGFVVSRILAKVSSAEKAKREHRTNLPVHGPEAIKAALSEALRTQEAVILTDMTVGSLEKFVQFAVEGGKLVLDIPEQQLSEEEQQALDTLTGISKRAEGSYQMQMPDIEFAVKVADSIFQNIFRTPMEYELNIEFV